MPALVNYQGRLLNPDGSALPTADYTLTFKLFDAATNGALVWGPQVFDGAVAQGHGGRVPVVQGWFNVMLGPVDINGAALSDAFNGAARYVEVTVSNRPPIAPRQQILTTPFAFQAANSAKLAGYDWSALLGTNNPLAGNISWSKMPVRPTGTNVGIGGIAVSLLVSNWNTASGTFVDVPDMTISLQTSGRPVLVFLANSGSEEGLVAANGYSGMVPYVHFALNRNESDVRSVALAKTPADGYIYLPPSTISFLDSPPPGLQVYKLRAKASNNSSAVVVNCVLVAFEL